MCYIAAQCTHAISTAASHCIGVQLGYIGLSVPIHLTKLHRLIASICKPVVFIGCLHAWQLDVRLHLPNLQHTHTRTHTLPRAKLSLPCRIRSLENQIRHIPNKTCFPKEKGDPNPSYCVRACSKLTLIITYHTPYVQRASFSFSFLCSCSFGCVPQRDHSTRGERTASV